MHLCDELQLVWGHANVAKSSLSVPTTLFIISLLIYLFTCLLLLWPLLLGSASKSSKLEKQLIKVSTFVIQQK